MSYALPLNSNAPPPPSLSAFPLPEVLALIRSPQVGPATFFHLLARYRSPAEALARLPELAKRGGRQEGLRPATLAEAEIEIQRTRKFGARLLVYGEAEYPSLLSHIPDPPPVLALSGHSRLWSGQPTVAMVGARNASANGCQLAQKLARELAAAGITIVSGLARGIDSFAHKGALAGGTAGVIAGGIDTVYPQENADLYRQMREHGAILSEQPFGCAPTARAFPARNRIIAGMCAATLVVEASPKSGSLITARLALEQGREVLAIPGSPLDPRSRGCNQLLKSGATLVEDAADVLEALAALRRGVAEHPPAPYLASISEPSEAEIAEARRLLAQALSAVPTGIEELIAHCQLSAPLALTALLELELAGKLIRQPGGKVCLRGIE